MSTTLPTLHFGGPSIPVHITLPRPGGGESHVWAHLHQDGPGSFSLHLGMFDDEADLELREYREMALFAGWLARACPDPHCNAKVGLVIPNTAPEEEPPDLRINARVILRKGVKCYAVAAFPEDLAHTEEGFHTEWPCASSKAFAEALQPLLAAIHQGVIDLRPRHNPLATGDDGEDTLPQHA